MHWAAGARTADLPSGTANYAGWMHSNTWSQVDRSNTFRYDVSGNLSLTADFDASTLQGRITNLRNRWELAEPREWVDLPDTTGFDISDGQIADGRFTATLTGTDTNENAALGESMRGYEGDVLGEFYGPNAEEVGGVINATRYERSDWNDTTVSSDTGVARLFDAGSVSGGLRVGRRWSGGERFHSSLGPWTRVRLRVSGSTELGVALSAAYRAHDESRSRDGWRIVASPRLLHVLDSRTSIEVEPTFEWVEAEADKRASRLLGLAATFSRAFDGGLSVSLTPSAHVRRFAGKDPLFGEKQVDGYIRLGAQVLHRSLRYAGFASYIGVALERNQSNIPIHEFYSRGLFAGISRQF